MRISNTKNTLKSNSEKLIALLFSLRAITFVWLAFASDIYMPWFSLLVLVLRYATIPIGVFYLCKQRGVSTADAKLLLPLIFYFLMLVVNTYGGYQGSYIHELISIGCFLLMNRDMKIRIFEYFYKIILISCAISIFVYVAYMLRIPIGFSQHPFYNDGVHSSYYQRWLIFAVLDNGYSIIPRLCGIFNEPGGLGTVCGLLFAATFNYSGKWEKIILATTTVLTLSLAGYVLIIVYLIIYLAQKSWKYAAVAVALAVLFFAIPHIDWGNAEINSFAQRFAITSEGLAGDNRVKTSFDDEYQLMSSTEVFFGKGATYTSESGTSSYKNYIMQFGILGFGVYLLLWLSAALKSSQRNRNCLILLLIFLISLYQRPVPLTNSYGYVLIFGGFLWILAKQQEHLKGKKEV